MTMTRRELLAGSAAGLGVSSFVDTLLANCATCDSGGEPDLHLGICDWSFGYRGNPAALAAGAKIGLEGIQISPKGAADTLSYATEEVQKAYKAAVKATGLKIASVGLTVTNGCPLATDPRGPAWLEQTINATAALGCTATLLAFFGKGSLAQGKQLKKREVDLVVGRLKEAAPLAKKKGVTLGLENTLSAKDNIRIMDRVGSDAVMVYYDIANSTNGGFDVPAEIRMLKGRINELHLKNTKGLFSEGGVDLKAVAKAILETKFKGWLIMERSFGKDRTAYFKKNGEYIRQVFGLKPPAKKA